MAKALKPQFGFASAEGVMNAVNAYKAGVRFGR
jgi:hypothetical protein